MKKVFYFLPLLFSALSCTRPVDYLSFPKIDAHVHIDTFAPDFALLAREHNFTLMTLVTRSAHQEHIDREFAWAEAQHSQFPETVFFATTICLENRNDPNWQQLTIDRLKQDFENGASAVKIWKDIGMTFRDPDSSFIMVDDDRFDPIFDFIVSQGVPVIGHLGEPRNCWLPLEEMTVRSDSNYFANHPEYHMALHPDYPSYEAQIDARDNMLSKHPDLVFIGAHLGSLEWNVDELAKRLDRFPNMAVDMAARICHFQVQERDKVRDFIIAYQDRLLYGTDLGVSENSTNLDWIANTWQHDWRYFTTDEIMTAPQVRHDFKGLKLPPAVLKKIYYQNAKKWLKI
ncbi:amidohydrolase family protein [candidate division KSB1 bacterium]|nr:amidohydrolase family protein [candidate division KSB1 bacterium]